MEQHVQENEDHYTREPIPKLRYAGFWMRFWAFVTDLVIVFSINKLLLIPLMLLNDGVAINISAWTLNGILSAIFFYLYFLFMTKQFGQTIGKMIFGIKVIREDLQPLQWDDLLFREVVGRFIYKIFFALNLLYFVVAFTPKKQGLHDMIVDTTVVHTE